MAQGALWGLCGRRGKGEFPPATHPPRSIQQGYAAETRQETALWRWVLLCGRAAPASTL